MAHVAVSVASFLTRGNYGSRVVSTASNVMCGSITVWSHFMAEVVVCVLVRVYFVFGGMCRFLVPSEDSVVCSGV